MNPKFSNKLVNETSPYLLQHAHNPVSWYPWGEEAIEKAKNENKPILVSIGYAACHWCHVMERESFENEEVAAFMNEHFVNIKIDREERPDLDHIYMDAVQAMTGSGGWPLNVFCLPDTKPFFGGTYFPPRPAYNRISWIELLKRIQHAWQHQRDTLDAQAGKLLDHISSPRGFSPNQAEAFGPDLCKEVIDQLMQSADIINGGFGHAPKFPQTQAIRMLLEYARLAGNDEARHHAVLCLEKMIKGGIYDQIGGGLARYSTDDFWLAPHFEKMLYDNALLIWALSDALMCTGNDLFRSAIANSFEFLLREMKDAKGGFYSAIDADSEGEEGKYYVWDKREIQDILGSDAEMYCKWYGINEEGNWEGKNILHITKSADEFCNENDIDVSAFREIITKANRLLFQKRNKRERPLTDDKIIIGWNALLLTSFCKAYAATGEEKFRDEAEGLYGFICSAFEKDGKIFHTYKNGVARHLAFLDDYAWFIEACVKLQEITGNQQYLQKAEKLTVYVNEHFQLPEGYYSYSDIGAKDLLFRKTEIFDGALPSGNSTMAKNLHFLGILLDKEEWKVKSDKMLSGIFSLIKKMPVSFSTWGSVLMYKSFDINQIILTGTEIGNLRKEILGIYLPGRIFQSSSRPSDFPLFRGKEFDQEAYIYLCINNLCLSPVQSGLELSELLKNTKS